MLRKAFTDECTQAVQRADMGLIYVVWATGKATVSIVTLGLWLEALGRVLVFRERETP